MEWMNERPIPWWSRNSKRPVRSGRRRAPAGAQSGSRRRCGNSGVECVHGRLPTSASANPCRRSKTVARPEAWDSSMPPKTSKMMMLLSMLRWAQSEEQRTLQRSPSVTLDRCSGPAHSTHTYRRRKKSVWNFETLKRGLIPTRGVGTPWGCRTQI